MKYFFMYAAYKFLLDIFHCKYFLPVCALTFHFLVSFLMNKVFYFYKVRLTIVIFYA